MARIHFLGVGKMGLPMATHLQAAGHALTVSDPSEQRLTLARSAGLAVAEPGALAQAEFVFSSLPHDAALQAVGEQVAQSASAGSIYVDTSTVSLAASAQVADLCSARGIAYLRTTVSGNNKMAEAALGLGLRQSRLAYPKPLHPRLDMLEAMMTAAQQQVSGQP